MSIKESLQSIGLLVLRVGFGLYMLIGHGWPKLASFSERSESFPDPLGVGSQVSMILAIAAEAGCSLLLVAGLGTRLAVLPLAFTMLIAVFVVHGSDPWQKKELAAAYLTVYVALMFTGGGRFSLDHLLFSKKKSQE